MILLDTDHLSVLLDQRDARRERLRQRMDAESENVACTIISFEEMLRGWLAAIRRGGGDLQTARRPLRAGPIGSGSILRAHVSVKFCVPREWRPG